MNEIILLNYVSKGIQRKGTRLIMFQDLLIVNNHVFSGYLEQRHSLKQTRLTAL